MTLARAQAVKREAYAIYFACRDPRVPWYAKLVEGVAASYVISPIQLIPNFIPLIGWVDDLFVMSVGLKLAQYLTPQNVLAECRLRAEKALAQQSMVARPALSWVVVIVVVALWLAIGIVCSGFVVHALASALSIR